MAVSKKEDKNKKEEKKPNTENDWEGFGYACLNNLIITLVYGLIGANFIFYVALKTQDRTNLKKKNGGEPQKLNEYFRVDNEHYNCLANSEDKDCKTSCNNIPYAYYDELDMKDVAKHTLWNRVTSMIPFVGGGGGEDKASISIVNANEPVPSAADHNAADHNAADHNAAVPSDAVPSDAVPSDAVPSAAVTSDAVPSAAVTSDAVPSAAVTSDAVPSAAVTSDAATAAAPTQEQAEVKGGSDPDFDEDCSDTPEEKCTPRKGPIDVSDMWVVGIWYTIIKDWLIESIAKTYHSERDKLHSLYGSFTSKKNCGFRGNDTVKMIIGPIITSLIICFSYFIGFFNFFIQCAINSPILFLIFLIIPIVPILGTLIGIEQMIEFLVKSLISPLLASSTEIFNTISAHPMVLIFVFGALTVSSAYTYLVNEISIPMTICWGVFTLYSWWNLSSDEAEATTTVSKK
jgi:hypothetical protein